MNDAIAGAALLAVGTAFIAIGINVLRMYKRSILSSPRNVLLWDAIAVLFTGPWSFPVSLAAIIISLGTIAGFFGLLVLVTVAF